MRLAILSWWVQVSADDPFSTTTTTTPSMVSTRGHPGGGGYRSFKKRALSPADQEAEEKPSVVTLSNEVFEAFEVSAVTSVDDDNNRGSHAHSAGKKVSIFPQAEAMDVDEGIKQRISSMDTHAEEVVTPPSVDKSDSKDSFEIMDPEKKYISINQNVVE
jgi:hypothetical protein